MDYNDRTTCVLFGDGAGAAVIKLDESLYVHKAYASGNFEGLNCSGVGKDNNYLHMDGKAVFEKRSMLKVEVRRNGKKVYSSLSLNDAVISAERGVSTIMLSVKRNSLPLCRLKADGLILATPTGSTAYSAAAGGPIVSPEVEAFVLTPLNSFSLSSRPIVLSPDSNLEITVEKSRIKGICLTVDGQEPFGIQTGDIISVILNKKKAKLVAGSEEKFYNALRSKLNWSGVPHA